MSFLVPEKYRFTHPGHPMSSDATYGNNGFFLVPLQGHALGEIRVIASDGLGWEHASVSLQHRAPTWAEMCLVKDIFWSPNDCVVQFHPPERDYVNYHPHCLHLWKSTTEKFPRPPSILIGPKER